MDNEQKLLSPNKNFFSRLWMSVRTSEYTYLVAAFFLPFTIMLGVYACLETHPFGNNSVLTLDLQAQYIYYYEEIRSLLVNGGSWLYSWKRTLGGEFMGIVAYYMGSPFNLLLVLFPKDRIADAVMFIQLCKIGTMGVTFGYYLHKTRRPGEMKTIAFSLMYALCAYSVVQTIDPMWLDALVFLPLLMLGTESLIRRKKVILYIISLSLIFISNYYMGYMCGIFTFFYFCYYYYTIHPEVKNLVSKPTMPGEAEIKRLVRSYGFRTFCRFALCTVAALGISAFMLYPAWYSLQFGKVGFVNSDFSLSLRFDFLDLFVKMLPGTYDSVNRQGLPMIFCGVMTVLAAPLFYTSKAIPKRQKIAATGMLLVMLVSFSVNTIDLVWHGFSAPNWLNYRYSYVFSFFILTMACDALINIRKVKLSHIILSGGVAAILVLIIQKLDYVFQQGDTKSVKLDDAGCILFSLVLIVAYTVIIKLIRDKKTTEAASFVLAAVVCVEMFVASLLSIIGVQTEVGLTKYADYKDSAGNEVYSSYTGGIVRIENVVNKILDSDKSFYRMESKLYRKLGGVNEPMAFGYNGISHSTSTLNINIIRMMERLGYSSQSHWTKYLGGTPVSDALLGIKYVITENETLDKNIFTIAAQGEEGYQVVVSNDTIYAMRNTKALSMAYGVSENVIADMDGSTYPPYISGLDFQNKLIMSMLSETDVSGEIFKGIAAGIDTENCERTSFIQTHKFYKDGEQTEISNPYYAFKSEGSGAKAIFDFTAPADSPIYFHFTAANFGKTFQVYVNGSKLSDYFGIETSCIMKLGDFKKGDDVTVELRLNNDELYISKESKYFFYYIDYSELNSAFSQLESAEMSIEKFGNDYLKGTIDLPAGQTMIFTTIPYDAGWNVYIDGKKADTVMVLDSLLAVKSTEGFHDIEFRYMPRGYAISFVITALALAVFILFILFVKIRKFREWVCSLFKKPCPQLYAGENGMIYPVCDVPDEDGCVDDEFEMDKIKDVPETDENVAETSAEPDETSGTEEEN